MMSRAEYASHFTITTTHTKSVDADQDIYRVRLHFKQSFIDHPDCITEQVFDSGIIKKAMEHLTAGVAEDEFLPIVTKYFEEFTKRITPT